MSDDRYRLKARELLKYWYNMGYSSADVAQAQFRCEKEIAAALAEAAREAIERAVEIILGSHAKCPESGGECVFTGEPDSLRECELRHRAAEAIRKEMP